MNAENESPARAGRAPSTSRAELSHIALQLFLEHGFDETTVDDIADAAGIGRRTLFRYFASKNDLPWGDFEAGLDEMRRHLFEMPADTPIADALAAAVLKFNAFPPEEIPYHRERMELLLNVPTLIAHSNLRYIAWRKVVSDYVALRLGVDEDALEPQAIGWIYLGISMSAYEQWLRHDDADLAALLETAFRMLGPDFGMPRQ
ncbi:MAG: mycofactocin system transcriptional regulator [Galbitalea sp.]